MGRRVQVLRRMQALCMGMKQEAQPTARFFYYQLMRLQIY